MVVTEQPTVYDAVKSDPRGNEYWIEGDDVQVADVPHDERSVGPEDIDATDAPDDVYELAHLAREEVERVEREYDLPFAAEDVTIVVADSQGAANGAASPIDCGEYESAEGEWLVEETPSGYVMFLSVETWRWRSETDTRETVRHELAHMTNWHEHGRTVEGHGIHAAALERFDTS